MSPSKNRSSLEQHERAEEKLEATSRASVIASYFERFPLLRSSSVIVKLDGERFEWLKFQGKDLLGAKIWFEPHTAGSLIPEPGWVIIFLPLVYEGRFLLTGREARDNRLFISVSEHGYATVGQRRITVGVGIRRERVERAFDELGLDHECLDDVALDLNAETFDKVKELFDSLCDPARRARPTPGLLQLDDDEDEAFVDGLLGQILPPLVTGRSVPLKIVDLQIVRRAEQFCETDLEIHPTLEQLREAAGVGRTRLWKAFTAIYDMSPTRYLQLFRLNRAREALLDKEAPPRSVKDIALAYGFTHSGRFAAAYGECFGEFPAQTLAGQEGQRSVRS
jgi:AraC-like DNA-binding protein